MPKDVEGGHASPPIGSRAMLESLGSYRGEFKRGALATLPEVPVGGHPGNSHFYKVVDMGYRLTFMCMLIGCMVWLPQNTKALGLERFAMHAGLAACLMVFFTTFTVGGVLNTASAGVSGCFTAVLNIFILRGFFADGVTPEMSWNSGASIVGWLDLMIFNMLALAFNCRMGFRMTAMALNTGFMMCFLNPQDQTVFSKNFQININGAAVSAFFGVCIGSLCAVLAVLLPYPIGWASKNMCKSAKGASGDMCKLFVAATKYFNAHAATVLIERQLAQSETLKAQIDGLGTDIGDAWLETIDVGAQGVVRVLHEKHAGVLGELFDVLHALQFAIQTEDFGPSHIDCMDAIAETAQDLVDAASIVLIAATVASEDGILDAAESANLQALEDDAMRAMWALSKAFDDHRKRFGKPVCKELMNESFFVFCISCFARKTIAYSVMLRTDPPKGKEFFSEMTHGIKELIEFPLWYHWRVVSRYWISLMGCFLFSVHFDNYVPSCAITGVFLINTRVGPDVMAMIQGLLAVVVGIVANALMYSFSCKYGDTASLMFIAFFFWLATTTIGKGNSSLSGIGLLMAALAPFALYKRCLPQTAASEAAGAIGLWGGIRALLIAVLITVICEFFHVPGLFTSLAIKEMDKAFVSMKKAFKNVWADENPADAKKLLEEALGEVSHHLGEALSFSGSSIMEPRLWNCPWKGPFLAETAGHMQKVRLDILLIKQALCGLDGDMEKITASINRVPEVAHMKEDLANTLQDAHELTMALLTHQYGEFLGLDKLDTVDGLDELDGYEQAIVGQSKVVKFPLRAPENMEEDELVRISIVYCMLEYLIQHLSSVTKCGVKLS
jgi:hypothetical protein